MSFREKSAWAMGAVMALTGAYFLWLSLAIPAGAPASLQLSAFVPYVFVVIVLSVVVQVALALTCGRDAKRPADERERIVLDRAGNWSGYVLGFAVITGALQYLWLGNGNHLFVWVIGGLILSQLAEYLFQIALLRRGV